MSAKIREIFTVRLKNDIKYTALVLTALILISVLSGCLTDKNESKNDEAYRQYFELMGDAAIKMGEAVPISREIEALFRKGDIKTAKEKIPEVITLHEEAYNYFLKATEIAPDDDLKKLAEYNTKYLEYSILFKKTMIKAAESSLQGDKENYKKYMEEVALSQNLVKSKFLTTISALNSHRNQGNVFPVPFSL